MIALGCDHGGYNLICAIKKYLDEKGLEYKEYGTFSEESVDYPVYARKVGHAIQNGTCDKGILICGTGLGISLALSLCNGNLCLHLLSGKILLVFVHVGIRVFSMRLVASSADTLLKGSVLQWL